MATVYLALALVLAVTLNAQARWLRVAGTLVAAAGLFMMVYSIILADLDGTFAAIPASAPLIERITPLVLNAQALVATAAILFLLWSAWAQARRPVSEPLPLRNDTARFGLLSRGFHWVMAVMMLCLVPIGLFMAVLPDSAAERGDFVAAHQSLGVTIFVLVLGRIAWLAASPPPVPLAASGTREHRLARLVHIGLYGALLLFPLSGFLMPQGGRADVYGLTIALPDWPAAVAAAQLIHAWVLPLLFYATLALHLLAVMKRHFADGETQAVRRMLR